jgi:pimeloyl-ACP methyl ester carboxylesterase
MRVHVRDRGDGPVVVLLHAFPCDGRMWQPQADDLCEAGWRVLVPDLPGFGQSALPDREPSLDDVAESVVSVLDDRGVDRCVLAGVSLGGYVTMAILRQRPDLAAGLVLCDTKATADSDAARENRERLARLVLESPQECARILEQAVLPGLLGDTTRAHRPEVVDRVRSWLGDATADTVAWYQRAMAVRPDSVAVLAAVDVPTLVLWGEEDALAPREEQDAMRTASTDADLVIVPEAGHLANVERPEAVTAAMRRFLDVVRGPRTS